MTVETSDRHSPIPLLFLHGALGSGAQMLRLADEFRGERPVLAPDFPGHGPAANGESEFTIGGFAAAICGFLDRHGIEKTDIFGYSMGGYVALDVARHHPERIGRIMTLGTKFAWNVPTSEQEAARLDPVTLERKVPAFAAQLRERHGAAWDRVVRSTARMMLGLGASPVLTAAELGSIPHRVLVVVGDRDAMVTVDETIGTARSLSAGECLVLPATPHSLDQVDRDLLVHHIRHFFTQEQSR